MESFLDSCVNRYCELANVARASLRHVDTPFLEESHDDIETPQKGALAAIASRVLMKVLYAARVARYDLLRPCCALASMVTKWDSRCDRKLHRLVSYINSSLKTKMQGWIGDPKESLTVTLYSDADFAGDVKSMRSTSRVFLCLIGPNTFYPLSACSKSKHA